jgi:hypothetical protein
MSSAVRTISRDRLASTTIASGLLSPTTFDELTELTTRHRAMAGQNRVATAGAAGGLRLARGCAGSLHLPTHIC